jgi:hypothetical protein
MLPGPAASNAVCGSCLSGSSRDGYVPPIDVSRLDADGVRRVRRRYETSSPRETSPAEPTLGVAGGVLEVVGWITIAFGLFVSIYVGTELGFRAFIVGMWVTISTGVVMLALGGVTRVLLRTERSLSRLDDSVETRLRQQQRSLESVDQRTALLVEKRQPEHVPPME